MRNSVRRSRRLRIVRETCWHLFKDTARLNDCSYARHVPSPALRPQTRFVSRMILAACAIRSNPRPSPSLNYGSKKPGPHNFSESGQFGAEHRVRTGDLRLGNEAAGLSAGTERSRPPRLRRAHRTARTRFDRSGQWARSRAVDHCVSCAVSTATRRRLRSSAHWPPSFYQTSIALAIHLRSMRSPRPRLPPPFCVPISRLSLSE